MADPNQFPPARGDEAELFRPHGVRDQGGPRVRRRPGRRIVETQPNSEVLMTTPIDVDEHAIQPPAPGTVDYKLEVLTIPVSDVDRAKAFYASLGWREDADFPIREGFR